MTTYTDKPAGLPCVDSSASFWHSEPNTFLLGHRTTDDLPESADIVIVGSGITGASIARFLAEDERAAHQKIVLLEAREICWGATGRNGGHCQPLLFDRTPEVAEFEVKNVNAVREYIEKHDVPCEWRLTTACRTFWNRDLFNAAKRDIEHLRQANSELASKVTCVGPDEVDIIEKYRVQPEVSGITLTQGAGQLWPYKYVTFIVEKLVKEEKINVQTHTPVTKIDRLQSAGSTGISSLRHKLTTPRGQISARNVILATNGYTSHLLHDFTSIIVPVRCEMSALHPPTGSKRLDDTYGTVGHEEGHPEHDDYLIQRPFYDSPNGDGTKRGGHLMFGGGRSFAMYECVGETNDDVVDPGEADYLRRALLKVLDLGGDAKDLKELKASHQWTGIKGYSRDNMPWVGKVPKLTNKDVAFEDGLWLCAGYTGHGMPNATLCGKAVVEMVLAESENVSYEAICKQLAEKKDLPASYTITAARLHTAQTMPSVYEQDGGTSYNRIEEKVPSQGQSKCIVS